MSGRGLDDEAVLTDVNTLLSRSKHSQGGFVKAWTNDEVGIVPINLDNVVITACDLCNRISLV